MSFMLTLFMVFSVIWLNPITAVQMDTCDANVDYQKNGSDFTAENKYEEAVGAYSCAIQNDPENPYVYLLRASAQIQINEYDLALNDLKKTITLSSSGDYENLLAHGLQGEIHFLFAEYEESITALNVVIGSNLPPDKSSSQIIQIIAIAYIGRARVYEAFGEYQLALDDLEMAIQMVPEIAAAYAARGFIHEQLGDTIAATADWNKAMLIDEKIGDSYGREGGRLYRLKQYDRALIAYSRAIQLRLQPNFYDFILRGIVYFHTNNCELAIEDLTESMRLAPDQWQPLFFRGRCYLSLGNYQEAVNDLTAYIDKNGLFPDTFLFRALAFAGLSDLEAAQSDYEKYIESVQKSESQLDTQHVAELLERISELQQNG